MRKIISLICFVLPILAWADELVIRDNAPDHYVVVKGDTLWDISSKFFKDPWKWPQIWGLNKETIKDPHWIYPGDVVFLDAASKSLHVGVPVTGQTGAGSQVTAESGTAAGVGAGATTDANIEKLSPKVRVLRSDEAAIPTMPLSVIGPFLKKPLVISEDELEGSPRILGALEKRALVSNSDLIYAKEMPTDKGENWQIYRPGKEFIDPESGESLGYEAIYLGDATVLKYADISSLRITNSVLEINKGDYLVQSKVITPDNFIPRAPDVQIDARVISIYGGVDIGGQNSVIALNKGRRDGLENGHVLALYHRGEYATEGSEDDQLPDYRYGLVFVFRTFEKVSYALVVETSLPVQMLDKVVTP
ncbi:MAG TPA: LysM peptidoglycan-binding domain-containing protein [Candidatus Paceibacterota bacterium]